MKQNLICLKMASQSLRKIDNECRKFSSFWSVVNKTFNIGKISTWSIHLNSKIYQLCGEVWKSPSLIKKCRLAKTSIDQVNYFTTKMQPARGVLIFSNVARWPKRVPHPWPRVSTWTAMLVNWFYILRYLRFFPSLIITLLIQIKFKHLYSQTLLSYSLHKFKVDRLT